jgi:hypothetical protein
MGEFGSLTCDGLRRIGGGVARGEKAAGFLKSLRQAACLNAC